MLAVVEALTPEEAEQLIDSQAWLALWMQRNDVPMSGGLMSFLFDRAAERAAPVDDPRRTDAADLRGFVERAVRLPPRLQQVAQLCLIDGLSLTACAARLGVSRETVRVHLRRLRATAQRRRGEEVTRSVRWRGRCARRRARARGGRARRRRGRRT